VRQRNEKEAVLSSMVEGVLAVDTDQRLITINQTAARLFGIDPARADGTDLSVIIRDTALRKLVTDALASDEPVEGEIVLKNQNEKVLHSRGTALRDAQGKEIGAVVVLQDVTRVRRLEQVRRDFVANVSHELRTPITSIKGFVETLMDGALNDPHDAQRFLGIIRKQADRLNAIIEDLLTLSRLEEEVGEAHAVLEPTPLERVLRSAIDLCSGAAAAKEINVELHCDGVGEVRVAPRFLERAVVNLIDNAIKYSESAGAIRVRVVRSDGEVTIRVEDDGCGISPEHLPRLFERFYRVDKARSRQLGGTGLGLAIVKHIANVHGGRVSVESTPGQGSVFSIHLPSA
jgi:two-component system phosphate regulon sensor histidine kinase PhoR